MKKGEEHEELKINIAPLESLHAISSGYLTLFVLFVFFVFFVSSPPHPRFSSVFLSRTATPRTNRATTAAAPPKR